MKDYIKKHKTLTGVWAILVLVVVSIALPFIRIELAIKDPNDPRFRAEDFRFENYPSPTKPPYAKAINFMFPIGTEKKYVEHILVKKAGATASYIKTDTIENGAAYHKKGIDGVFAWSVEIQYDSNGNLKEIVYP